MMLWKKFYICVVVIGCFSLIYFLKSIDYSSYVIGDNLTVLDTGQSQRDSNYPEPVRAHQPPLITLFTSWSTFPERFRVFNNTLRNWPLLRPHANIILFTNDTIPEEYKQLGWMVQPITHQIKGHPVLKNLFIKAMQLQPNSKLYGFSNGDILFTKCFINSLREITNSPLLVNKTYMVVGRRMNIPNVTREEARTWTNIERAAERGELMDKNKGIDYFVTSPGYHWKHIPEVQIGQKLYDNWLIMDARRMGHQLIDATNTLLAVHQNAPYQKEHGRMNNNLVYIKEAPGMIYAKGVIPCCKLHTVLLNHTIKIQRRNRIPKHCTW